MFDQCIFRKNIYDTKQYLIFLFLEDNDPISDKSAAKVLTVNLA